MIDLSSAALLNLSMEYPAALHLENVSGALSFQTEQIEQLMNLQDCMEMRN